MSSSPVAAAPSAVVAHQNSPGRLINVIVDPAAAFRGISEDSPWALAFVAAIAIRFGSLFVFYHPAVTPLKLIASVLFQVATVAPVLLVASAIMWIAARVHRFALTWSTSFSVATHIYAAYSLVTVALASIAGALLPESADIDPRSPPFTNLVPLVASWAPPLIARLAAEADVRSLYTLALLWLALRAAAPSEPPRRTASVMGAIVAARLSGVLMASLLLQ